MLLLKRIDVGHPSFGEFLNIFELNIPKEVIDELESVLYARFLIVRLGVESTVTVPTTCKYSQRLASTRSYLKMLAATCKHSQLLASTARK
jgi:hypothetical protein